MFFLVFDVAKCIRAVNIPSNMQCIYTRPSRLSATQFTEKGHLAMSIRTRSLEPGCMPSNEYHRISTLCVSPRNTYETSHRAMFRDVPPLLLYCETPRDIAETIPLSDPRDIYETLNFITFLSSRAVLDSAALLYRLSYRGPSRPSALSTRYAGASSRPQASNASVMLPVFFIFPCVLCALPAKRFQTLWVR